MLSTGLVIYYIQEYSAAKVSKTKSILNKLSNEKKLNLNVAIGDSLDNLAENLPVGTVVCIDMSDAKDKSAHVCLPMLTTHISLPLKPGEIVWFYKDTTSSFDEATISAHPLLALNNYWLSRKVGSRISEDLSFSFASRDVIISNNSQDAKDKLEGIENTKTDDKKRRKKIKEEEDKKIKLPDYILSKTYTDKYPFLNSPEYLELYSNSKKNQDVFPTAVPRWNSKPFELSLQGSNNSLVNLTKSFTTKEEYKSSGAIDLVAGRHMIEDYLEYSEEDFYTLENKIIDNEPDEAKRKIDKISINTSTSYLKTKNLNEDEEVLKSQKAYFGEEFKLENLNVEGENNFNNDASRIYITEFDNLDNNAYYNSSNISFLDKVSMSEGNEVELKLNKKDFFVDVESVIGKNFPLTKIKNSKEVLPSILLKSNDIRLIARKSVGEEKKLEEGSIRLVKESNNFYNSSCLLLEKDGSIILDGSTIQVGNFRKELERQNIDAEDDEAVITMAGKGNGLLIGYDPNFSEPLVLGNTLEAMLKEMMHININLIEEIKKLTDELATHTHVGIPMTGVSGPPQVPVPYNNFSNVEHDKIKKRYEDLQAGLKEMLSKFAKTSWCIINK